MARGSDNKTSGPLLCLQKHELSSLRGYTKGISHIPMNDGWLGLEKDELRIGNYLA